MIDLKQLDTGYTCPVCGSGLNFKAWDKGEGSQEICSCCGTQFGYYDAHFNYDIIPIWKEIRQKWINNGMVWKHNDIFSQKPSNWNPKEQLKNIPIEFLSDDEDYGQRIKSNTLAP